MFIWFLILWTIPFGIWCFIIFQEVIFFQNIVKRSQQISFLLISGKGNVAARKQTEFYTGRHKTNALCSRVIQDAPTYEFSQLLHRQSNYSVVKSSWITGKVIALYRSISSYLELTQTDEIFWFEYCIFSNTPRPQISHIPHFSRTKEIKLNSLKYSC
jgi:hypothetical protein